MTEVANVSVVPAPFSPWGARRLIRWVCTKNPFYVISAGLFLAGLWISFGDPARAEDTWALMSGLGGYTLLLAAAALLLVRFANVWDDVRTVLLLVVLMFLATSVTFDEVLVLSPARGFACYLGGLLFAVTVSECLLRGIRLKLPAWYRLPYYLILTLFFVYPLALRSVVDQPRSEVLMWGLFGFSPVAGLIFLTLLPAIRRGPEYVRDNGSPWPWPLYPWSLFAFLAFAVPGRAFLLCWSMHLLDGGDFNRLIFGPYFVVPFGLALAVLLLEAGLVSGRQGPLGTALALPAVLVAVAMTAHRADPMYQTFLEMFNTRLGGSPPYLTLLAAVGFYAYAAVRRAPAATEALTAALLALTVVGPETLTPAGFVSPLAAPLLAAALLQLAVGMWRRDPWRCLAGGIGLAAVVSLVAPAAAPRGPIAYHLVLLVVLIVGALFKDACGRWLRSVAASMVLLTCLWLIVGDVRRPEAVPPWLFDIYPLLMAAGLAAYGRLLRHPLSQAAAALIAVCWLVEASWRGYRSLRQLVVGLDYLSLSMALFGVAILISLGKSGLLPRWLPGRRQRVPNSTE